MVMGYCPYCQKNVHMKKEDFRVGLAIVLLVFTAGFGLFIYLMIYLDKKAEKCIYCGSKCQPLLINYQSEPSSATYLTQEYSNGPSTQLVYQEKTPIMLERASFCPNCGGELNADHKFCSFCGNTLAQ